MARTIVTRRDLGDGESAAFGKFGSQPAQPPDGYKDRLLKYIPAEVITLYITLGAILKSTDAQNLPHALPWIVFAVCLAATPLYLWRVTAVLDRVQLLISTLAFVVWGFTLGGPFADLAWYQPIYGAILLPLFTFTAALIEPPPSPSTTAA